MTEDEIIEQQRLKDQRMKQKHADVNDKYFKQKFDREKNAL